MKSQKIITLLLSGLLTVAAVACSTPETSATISPTPQSESSVSEPPGSEPVAPDAKETSSKGTRLKQNAPPEGPPDVLPEEPPEVFPDVPLDTRDQYETVPLDQLLPEVPLYHYDPAEVAMIAFGRTTLEEGEKETVITGPQRYVTDDIYIVYLTNEGLADDSVGGFRYRLDFVPVDGDQSQLIWVGKQWSCRRGSSAGEWTGTGLCP